jgi:hypothetical protein
VGVVTGPNPLRMLASTGRPREKWSTGIVGLTVYNVGRFGFE